MIGGGAIGIVVPSFNMEGAANVGTPIGMVVGILFAIGLVVSLARDVGRG